MIGYLRGQVFQLMADHCILDVNGVGYRLYISNATRQKLSAGSNATLHTYLNVREDALLLYGFFTSEEYELFCQLITVTGIGPKAAVSILSAVTPDGFRLAVSQKNLSVLTKIPGIGKKTAERLILELKDKLGQAEGSDEWSNVQLGMGGQDIQSQALQALTALGYSQAEVAAVLRQAAGSAKSVEEAVRLVLREMGSGR